MEYIKWIRNQVPNGKIILNSSIAIIRNQAGEILFQKRGDDGNWGLVGGLCELEETPEMTCVREVYEETGISLDIDQLNFLGYFTNMNRVWPNGDPAQVYVFAFYTEVINPKLICDGVESVELKFFPIGELPVMTVSDNKDALARYLEMFKYG